jgi:hypothetical protein
MDKKENHTNKRSKLSRFRTFEEMKADPPRFPSTSSPEQRLADLKEAFGKLRSTYSEGQPNESTLTNKKALK